MMNTLAIGILALTTTSASQKPLLQDRTALTEAVQERTLQRLDGLGPDWARRAGHFRAATPAVPRAKLPAWVVQDAATWMRKILKPEIVPTNLDSMWYGLPKAPDRDLVVASYSVGANKVTWIDNESQMILLVKYPDEGAPTSSEEVTTLVRKTFETYLNLPANWRKSFAAPSAPVGTANTGLWYGQVVCGEEMAPDGRVTSKRNWYSFCPFWTDGATVYIELSGVENDLAKWNPDLHPYGSSRLAQAAPDGR
jgi:hypothetical protein